MRSIYPILTTLVFSLISLPMWTQTPNEDWPQQDGFSERTSHVITEMTPPFELARTIDVGEDISDFVYSDNVVYFSFIGSIGRAFGAYSLDMDQVLWKRAIPEARGSVGCYPTVSGDLVYVGAQRGAGFYALDKMSGDSVWFYPTESHYGRPAAVKGDKLFLQPPAKGLLCFDKYTGEVLWEYGSSSAQTVPLVDDKHVYFTSRLTDTIYALTHEGELVWKYRSPSGIDDFEAFLSHGDSIFLKTRGHIVALNQDNGSEFWKTALPDSNSFISGVNALTWSPHVLISHEWIGDWQDSFKIQGFDYTTGTMKWSHDLEPRSGASSVSFGSYLVNNNGGDLQIRRAEDGEVVQNLSGYNIPSYERVKVVDGIFLASRGSEILLFTPITTSVSSPGHNMKWQILENPIQDELVLEVMADQRITVDFQIVSLNGTYTGISGSLEADSNPVQRRVDISSLPSGQYLVNIRSGQYLGQLAFVKQ